VKGCVRTRDIPATRLRILAARPEGRVRADVRRGLRTKAVSRSQAHLFWGDGCLAMSRPPRRGRAGHPSRLAHPAATSTTGPLVPFWFHRGSNTAANGFTFKRLHRNPGVSRAPCVAGHRGGGATLPRWGSRVRILSSAPEPRRSAAFLALLSRAADREMVLFVPSSGRLRPGEPVDHLAPSMHPPWVGSHRELHPEGATRDTDPPRKRLPLGRRACRFGRPGVRARPHTLGRTANAAIRRDVGLANRERTHRFSSRGAETPRCAGFMWL
jgi:hypothetical protein